MQRGPALVLLAALVSGCVGGDDASDAGTGAPAAWIAGDAWTYRLETSRGSLEDVWTVQGSGAWKGRPVVEVRSVTTGPGFETSDLGRFDASTLALVRVDAEGLQIDFDPAEVWLLPAEDRTYRTTITETRPEGTRTAQVSYLVDHRGVETVETDAGPFSAHRFEVRKTLHSDRGSSEESFTYWWSPAALNVVREDAADGTPIRMLTAWSLANGERLPPPVDP